MSPDAASEHASLDPGVSRSGDTRPHEVVVRPAERRDADGIRVLYNHFVQTSTALFDLVPRTLDEQVQWIDEHSGGHPAVVAALGDGVAGFGSLSPFRPRPAYATSVEDSVYVDEALHGRGIGRQILEALLRLAVEYGFHAVFARITGDNEASIALHAACGFEIVGREREVGRKFGRWLDVVEMQKLL